MKYWQPLVKNPLGEKSMDDFAMAIDKIPKIVFSHTLKNVEWESAKLANHPLEKEVLELRQQPGRDILVGSRSLIIQLMKLNLIDEYQLCIHPVVVGSGLPLFENINDRTVLKLIKTKTFSGGAVTLYYEPTIFATGEMWGDKKIRIGALQCTKLAFFKAMNNNKADVHNSAFVPIFIIAFNHE